MSIISCITNNGYESGIGPMLTDNTPEQIRDAVRAGVAEDYWSIGDAIPITLNGTVGVQTFDNETYYAFIIGFNHNSEIEGDNTLHMQFGKMEDGTDIFFADENYGTTGTTDGFRMNNANNNLGGWSNCYMRKTICSSFLNVLPESWQEVITDCKKYTDNTGNAAGNTEANISLTEDKIFLLSAYEVAGSTGYANDYEEYVQEQYEYYANGNSKLKYKYDDTDVVGIWWLRSVHYNSTSSFCYVNTNGTVGSNNAYYSRGFTPCFQIS